MLFTIGLWRRAGLLKLWVTAPNGVAKCNFGVAKPIGLTNQIKHYSKMYKRLESRPAVNLFLLYCILFLRATYNCIVERLHSHTQNARLLTFIAAKRKKHKYTKEDEDVSLR